MVVGVRKKSELIYGDGVRKKMLDLLDFAEHLLQVKIYYNGL